MPDGETGPRYYFTAWQRSILPEYIQLKFDDGRPSETKPLTAQEVDDAQARLESAEPLETGYDVAAMDSYKTFASLKKLGVISKFTKFQVRLPTPANVMGPFVRPELQAAAEPIYEAALYQAISNIQNAIPHGELAIQIDQAVDTAFWEGVVWDPYFREGDRDAVKKIIVDSTARMIAQIDTDVAVGIHNCYVRLGVITPNGFPKADICPGDMEHKRFLAPTSLAAVVDRTLRVMARMSRPLDFVHFPIPKSVRDHLDAYCAPLADILPKLKQHGTDLYLGVGHHNHASATKGMIEAAEKVLDGYLVAEQAFSKIQIFEQRSTVGGIWNYVPCPTGTAARVARGYSDVEKVEGRMADTSTDHLFGDTSVKHVEPLTPLYDRLETNIPRDLMGFSDLDWPKDTQLFPKHETVLEYIEQYAEDVRHLIAFRAQVNSVHPEGTKWHVNVTVPQISGSRTVQHHTFDAVIVASGHFDVPNVPAVAGMESWVQAYPGSILHSKYYRTPEQYADKKIIVVGNSASGIDIGAQIRTVCRAPLIASTRSASYLQTETLPEQVDKPAISEYIVKDRTVVFADGSREQHVDNILYCTGYFYSFDFLEGLDDEPIVTSGERVENLYQHLFYRPNPSLIFPTLNQKIIPFPFAEAQAAVIARVLAGRLSLPSALDMKQWENATVAEMGAGREFHVLKFPRDADYINMMHDWAMRAQDITAPSFGGASKEVIAPRQGNDAQAMEYRAAGAKRPPYWTEREYWMRERFSAIKEAFQDFGGARHSKSTLADVGFVFNG
nr:hypothetical protein B0A51_05814 [Rachicladosporium sp. CCFEE 5018]